MLWVSLTSKHTTDFTSAVHSSRRMQEYVARASKNSSIFCSALQAIHIARLRRVLLLFLVFLSPSVVPPFIHSFIHSWFSFFFFFFYNITHSWSGRRVAKAELYLCCCRCTSCCCRYNRVSRRPCKSSTTRSRLRKDSRLDCASMCASS